MITKNEIIDILGLNLECYSSMEVEELVLEFNRLLERGYDKNSIWLNQDFGIYTEKKLIDRTMNLVVANAI